MKLTPWNIVYKFGIFWWATRKVENTNGNFVANVVFDGKVKLNASLPDSPENWECVTNGKHIETLNDAEIVMKLCDARLLELGYELGE